MLDVIHGKLKAKQKLKLNELKDSYNASISTLREVLNRLINDGFIVAEEQKGFFVAPLTKKHFQELIDLRYMLESNMLKLSIKAGDIEWESQIMASHHRLFRLESQLIKAHPTNKEAYNNHDLCMADLAFHKAILSSCNSTELISLHQIIYTKYLRYQISVLGFRGENVVKEHKDLLQCCLDRKIKEATQVLKTHIYGATQLLNDIID